MFIPSILYENNTFISESCNLKTGNDKKSVELRRP